MIESLQPYTRKSEVISPEQAVLAVFVPMQQRVCFEAWAALQYELFECVFTLEHEPVRTQKSQWWAEELVRTQNQTPRHPITQMLAEYAAPYANLAAPLLALAQQVPLCAASTADVLQQLSPLACAVDACENALFAGSANDNSRSIALAWLSWRLPHGLAEFDRAMLPMHLRARYPAADAQSAHSAALRDWLSELQNAHTTQAAGNWYREAQRRFTQHRLLRLQKNTVPSIRPIHAWHAWRALRTYQSQR